MSEEDTTDNEANLLSDYAQRRLLLSTDIEILQQAIIGCEPEQLENIMEMAEDELMEYGYQRHSLDHVQHLLAVWFIALRTWDAETTDERSSVTRIDFETLKYDQHWDS